MRLRLRIDRFWISTARAIIARSLNAVAIFSAFRSKTDVRLRVEILIPVGADVLARSTPTNTFFTARRGAFDIFGARGALAEKLLLSRPRSRLVDAGVWAVAVRAIFLVGTRHLNRGVAAGKSTVIVTLAPAPEAIIRV